METVTKVMPFKQIPFKRIPITKCEKHFCLYINHSALQSSIISNGHTTQVYFSVKLKMLAKTKQDRHFLGWKH